MKRIISFVLCLSMLLSMLPVNAFAADLEDDLAIESTTAAEEVTEGNTEVTEAPAEATSLPTEAEQEANTTEAEPEANAPEESVSPEVQPTEETLSSETESTEETVPSEESSPTEETEGILATEETVSESSMTGEELLAEIAADGSTQYSTSNVVLVMKDLTIPAGETVTIENPGYMQVLSGAVLTVEGSMEFPSSSLTVEDGGSLILKGEGYLGFYGGSTLTIDAGASYTIEDSASIYANDGTTLTGISKGEVCNSNMIMDPDTDLQEFAEIYGAGYKDFYLSIATDYTVSTDMTLGSHIVLDHYGNTVTITDGATLMITGDWNVGMDATVYGGDLVPGHIVVENGTLVIDGSLNLLYGSTLTVAEGGCLINRGGILNNGSITVSGSLEGSGTVSGSSIVYSGSLGTFLANVAEAEASGAHLTVADEITLARDLTINMTGKLTFADSAKLTVPDGVTLTLNCPTAFDGGQLVVNEGGTVNVNGNLQAAGDLQVDGIMNLEGDMTLGDDQGSLVMTNVGSNGQLNLKGSAVLEILGGGQLDFYGPLNVSETASIYLYGSLSGGAVWTNNGLLHVGEKDSYTGYLGGYDTASYIHGSTGRVEVELYGGNPIECQLVETTRQELVYSGCDYALHMLDYVDSYASVTIDYIDTNDYGEYWLFPLDDSSELTIGSNVTLNIGTAVHFPVTVSNYGHIQVGPEGKLFVDEVLKNYGGSVVIGSSYEDTSTGLLYNYLWDGSFGTIENFPKARLYAAGKPVSALGMNVLSGEVLTGKYAGGLLTLENGFVIDEDVTLDAPVDLTHSGGAVTITNGATLTVAGHWTVDNAGTILVENGTLVIDGTLDLMNGSRLLVAEDLGAVTENGTINGTVEEYVAPMTADELVAAMEEAMEIQGWYQLTREVVISSDVTLPEDCSLTVAEGGKITVTEGSSLTFGSMFIDGGSVAVESGGLLYALQIIHVDSGSLIVADESCYYSDYGYIYVNSKATVSGFAPSMVHFVAEVDTEAELRTALDNDIGYQEIEVIIMSSITLAEDLTVPEGTYMAVGVNILPDPGDFDAEEPEISIFLTVPKDVTLTNYGQIGINSIGYMTVAEGGTLINHGTFFHQLQLTVNGTHIEEPLGDYGMDGAVVYGKNAVRPEDNMTQAELEDAILTASGNGETCFLRGTYVTVSEALTVDTGLYYDGNSIITVKSGATLTLTEETTCYGASLYVEDGGKLVLQDGAKLHVTWGILSIADGAELVVESGGGIVADESAILENVGNDSIIRNFYVHDEAGLLEAIAQDTYAGADIWITEYQTIELTADLVIPENVTIRMLNSNTLRIPSGVVVINEGTISAQYYGTLEIAEGGTLINNSTVHASYEGFVNIYGTMMGNDVLVEEDSEDYGPGGTVEGSVTGMSQDVFEEALAEGGAYTLSDSVYLTRDLTVGADVELTISETLIVSSGITLTLNGYTSVYDGVLVVQDGAEVVSNAGFRVQDVAEVTISGSMESNFFMGISGDSHVYANVLTLNSSVWLSDNAVLEIGSALTMNPVDPDSDWSYTELFDSAKLIIGPNATLYQYDWISNGGGTILIQGTLSEDSTSFISNWTQTNEFGTVEGYPVDKLFASAIVTSIDDVHALIAEFQNGKYISASASVEDGSHIVISEDFTLPEKVEISFPGTSPFESALLTIEEGTTFTIEGSFYLCDGGTIENYGTLDIKHQLLIVGSGTVENHGTLRVYPGSSFVNVSNGTYDGIEITVVSENGELGSVHNFDDIPKILYALCANEAQMRSAFSSFTDSLYISATVVPTADITLTDDLFIPLGSVMVMNGGLPKEEEEANVLSTSPITFTIPEGVTLTNDDSIEIGPDATMVVAGTLENPGVIAVAENGTLVLEDNAVLDMYRGTLMVYGNLTQGDAVINSYRSDVQLTEGSLNIAEGYLVNHLTDGSFGTVEGYPAEHLYVQCCPESVDDIHALIEEYQSGNYACGTVLVESAFTVDEDLTLPEGVRMVVSGSDAALCIGTDAFLSVEPGAELIVENSGTAENNAYLDILGQLTVRDGGTVYNALGINCGIYGTITAEEGSITGPGSVCCYYTPEEGCGSVTGVDSQSVYLMCETVTTEEDLLGLLDYLAESGYSAASIPIHESLTLTKELVLPEGSAIFLQSDSETITFTVTEEAQVTNYGQFFVLENAELVIEGRWMGNLPVADDESAVSGMPMTEEAFLALLAEAAETGYPAELEETVILSQDLELNQNLIIYPHAKLIIPAGVRLTNQNILNTSGSLILDEGAEFVNEGNVLAFEGSRIQAADGTYLSEPAKGALCCACDSADSVTGIGNEYITLYRDCNSFDELVDALTLAEEDGFSWSWLFLRDSMEISGAELVIPETCMLVIMPLMQYGGVYNEITINVPETTTVVNNGLVQVGMYATLTVNGQWSGNAPMDNGGTISGDFFTVTEEEFADMITAGSGTISGDLILTTDIAIPAGCVIEVNGCGTITVSEGASLTVEGQLILSDNASIIVDGLLVNKGEISVRDNAVLNAEGATTLALFTTETEETTNHYIHYDNATIKAVYWGDGTDSTVPTLMGVPTVVTTVVVTGSTETFIREMMDEVALSDVSPKEMEILIEEDLTLTESLQLPSYATLNVSGASLTVPSGVTLSNSGQTLVQEDSKLEVQGNLTGNLPKLESDTSEFVYDSSDISYSQDTLEAQLAQSALTGETVVLSLPLTLTKDLEIPAGASLELSGAAITVPADRILTNLGQINLALSSGITVLGGGTLENGGSITVRSSILNVIDGDYIHNEGAGLYLITPTGVILGDLTEHMTHVADVSDESGILSALELANVRSLEIRLTGNVTLTEDLVIPEYALLTIENGTLTVPEGMTLTNNGSIALGWMGLLKVEQGGMLIGNQPTVSHFTGEYVNESIYDQSYLEELLANAGQYEEVLLDVPVKVTGALSLDMVNLTISGEGVYLILEEGAELTNNYFLYCENGGGILSNGGTLVNNRTIYAQYGGIVDMTNGSYEGSGTVYNKSICDAEGNVTHAAVLGIALDNIVIQAETYSDDQVIRDTIAYVDSLVESGMIANPEWGGFFSIRFVGDTTLSADLELPYYSDPIITAIGSLTVPEGMTLTDHSGMRVAGTLTANGQVVATGFPFMADSEDCLVNPENCTNYYIDDLALEDITVTPSQTTACVGQSIELVIDSWYPANAKYFGDYGVSFDIEDFDGYYRNEDNNLIVYTNKERGPCEVTVTITATDEYDTALENSEGTVIAKSVTLNFVNQEINMFCEGLPDFYENGLFGIYAGNSIEMYANFTGVEADRDATFDWDAPELDPEVGTWSLAEGILTITASEDLTTHETVQVTVRHPENAELYASTTIHLRPKASSVDVALNEQIVTGETVLLDLNRDGTSAKLMPVTTPEGALCENGYNADYSEPLIQWSTSNKNVATVDAYGNVAFTGKTGTVKITMKTNFGSTVSSVVTFKVVALAQEIVSSASNATALIGGSSATYTVYDPNVSETALKNTTVEWFLCDKDGVAIDAHPYAAITAKGKLTTKTVSDETKVYLMARVIGDEYSAALSEPVLVKLYPAITSVQILDELDNTLNGQILMHDLLKDGDAFSLYSAVAPYSEAAKSIVWGPVKNSVTTVDPQSGLVTVLKPGTVKFTLTVTALNNKKTTANVTMKFGIFTQDLILSATMPDGSFEDPMNNLTVYGGESVTFGAVPVNADGTQEVTTGGVKWALSDKAGGSISTNGVLKTKAVSNPLTVTVTVTSKDGNCSRSIPVTILPKPVTADDGTAMDALVIRSSFGFITKTTQTIGVEEGFTVSAVDARTGEAVDVTWTSSKTQYATIGETDGIIQPVDKGTTTITATDSFGRTASFTLKVNKLSKSVAITVKGDAEPVVASGKALTLVGTVTYSNNSTDKKVTWSMTDESGNAIPKTVATLSSSGKLTAAKGLTAATVVLVRADAKDGNPNAYAVQAVTILPAATGVEIYGPFGSGRDVDISNTTQKVDLTCGDTLQLSATVYPYYGSEAPMNAQNAMQGVTWKSSSAKIAAIDPSTGIVECLKAGTVTITATANDGSGKKATFKLTVHKTVDTLTLPATAFIGGSKSLNIPYSIDGEATNKTLTWTMVLADKTGAPLTDAYGNELEVSKTLATLSKGTLKTKKVTEPQYLLVRAEATDGSEKKAQCFITIYPVISGVTLYQEDSKTSVPTKVISLPVNRSYTVLPDANNVKGCGSQDDNTADEYLENGAAWTVTLSKEIATVEFDGQALTVKARTDIAAPINQTVKITLKAIDGSNKSASFSIKFTEADEREAVTLSVWTPPADVAADDSWLNVMMDQFTSFHPELDITWDITIVYPGEAASAVANSPENVADV